MNILVCIYICVYIDTYIIFLFFHLSSGLRRINMLVGISLTGGIGNQLEKKIKINNIHEGLYILLRN